MGVTSSQDVDVGLAVEEEHVGVTVHSPQLGVVKIALQVAGSGAPRLTALERVHGGRTHAAALDAGLHALELEAQLARAELALVRFELHQADVLAEAVTARDEARDRAAALAEQLKSLETSGSEETTELQRRLHEASSATQLEREGRLAALAERERTRTDLQAEVDALKAKLTGAEASSAELEAKAQTLELDLATARLRGDDAEERTLAAEAKLKEADDRASDADGRVRAADEKVLAAEAKATDAEGRLAGEQAAKDELQAKASELELKLVELEAKLASAGDTAGRVTELEAQVLERDGRIGELEATASAQQARIGDLEERAVTANTRVSELEEKAAASSRVADLEAKVLDRDARVAELEAAVADLEPKAAAAARVAELEQKLTDAETNVTELHGRLLTAEQGAFEAENLRAQLAEKEQALLDEKARSEQLAADLRAATGRAAELQNEATSVGDAAARIATLTAERDEARAVARQLQQASAKLQTERDEARTIARGLHGQLEPLKAEVKSLKERLAKSEMETGIPTTRSKVRTDPAYPGSEATAVRPVLQPADSSRQPTVPYNLQKIRAGLPAEAQGWGEENTVTEPLTTSDRGTDPSQPAYKPKKG